MKSLGHRAPVLADFALLLTRVALGVVFIAHGWQKFNEWGLDGTRQSFADMGIPAPALAAQFSTWVELVGGALLILGAFMPVVGALLAVNMFGALVYVHAPHGIFASENGYEMVLVFGITSVLLAVVGSGRFGVDGLLGRQKSAVRKTVSPVHESAEI